MLGSRKRKQSLYFSPETRREIAEEATRQDRSISWIVQQAWRAARKEIMSAPRIIRPPRETPPRRDVAPT
jgi:uncharacterized small protein (TIGR04563 family)